jgi:hypothetical protein
MTRQTNQNAKTPVSQRAEWLDDLLIVSSFGLWALLLGLAPVLALRMLTGT